MPAQRKDAPQRDLARNKDREFERLLRTAARLHRARKVKLNASRRTKRSVA